MNFTKKLSLLLVAGAFSGVAVADPITVYGKANVSAQSTDEGDGSFTELKSNASRVGVKGDYELDNGMSVFYTFEWQVDLTDNSGSDNIKSRNQFVGLKGDFGKVMLGRKDTTLKEVSKPVDLFNDYEADLKGLWKGENRMSDMIAYESPSFSGLKVGLTYVTEDDADGEDGVSASIFYGDAKLKKSKVFAALTFDQDIKGYDVQRAVISGKVGSFTLGAIAHKQEAVESGSSDSGVTVSAQYSVNAWKLKAQYQSLEDDNSVSVGADYKLGKNTKAYAWYTNRGLDQSEDKRWLAVGVEHKFSM